MQKGTRRAKATSSLVSDQAPRKAAGSNAEQFLALLKWLFAGARTPAGLKPHGNRKWQPTELASLVLLWVWCESRNVTDAFETAVGQYQALRLKSVGTYQGMMMALVSWTTCLKEWLWDLLHQRMREIGGSWWTVGEWVPIAFDGSRSSTPRTRSAETAFCAPNRGKGKKAKYRKRKKTTKPRHPPKPQEPQVWITLLWHMGLRLPWLWQLGPSNSSERGHVIEMLQKGKFPSNTLFNGDAGFIGHPLWSTILSRGYHFLVRVGANVHLLAEENIQVFKEGGLVLCWPEGIRCSKRPPLRLRLLQVTVGKTRMWMLTSVLDEAQLSVAQVTRLYHMRWGIELEFRGLKQTLDHGKLRCRTDKRILVELDWSLMGMAVAELFALKEQLAVPRSAGSPPPAPEKRSLAETIRALRISLARLAALPPGKEELLTLLREAVTDSYRRTSSKQCRYRTPNPDKKPLGDPTIRELNSAEKMALQNLNTQKSAA